MILSLNISLLVLCCVSYVVHCENIVICEDDSYSINCGYNKYISIENAKWGRDDMNTCGHHLISCTDMVDKTSTIKSLCHEKLSCFVGVSENRFGSPCSILSGVWVHYMRITYNCYVKNECNSNPCLNGTCYDGVDLYTCICYPGYYGNNCQHEFNECDSNPCVNGKCIDKINSYQCNCDPGYIGVNCQHERDECRRNPCVFGNCTNNINSYKCDCEPGYTGVNCQHDIDECQSNPCVHGNCINNVNHYKCLCYPGFSGINCENETDECFSSPCVHGTCVSPVNKYECRCSGYAFGVNCEYSIFDYTVPITIIFGILLFLMSLLVFYVTTKVRKIDDDLEDNKMKKVLRHYNVPNRDQAKLMFDIKKLQQSS